MKKPTTFQHAKFWISLLVTFGIIALIIVALVIGFHPHHTAKRQNFTPHTVPPPPLSHIKGGPDFKYESGVTIPPTFTGFTVHQFDPITKTGVGIATSGSLATYTQALFLVEWVDGKLEYGAQIGESRTTQTAMLTAYSGDMDPSFEYIAEHDSNTNIIHIYRRSRTSTGGFEKIDLIMKGPGSLITGTSSSSLQNNASAPIYVNSPIIFIRPDNTPHLYLTVASTNRAVYFYNMTKTPSIASFVYQTPNNDNTTLQAVAAYYGHYVLSFAGDTSTVSSDQTSSLQIAKVSVSKDSAVQFSPTSVVLPFSTDTEYFKSIIMYDDKVVGLSNEELVFYKRDKNGPIFEEWSPFHTTKLNDDYEPFGLRATSQGELLAFYSHKSTVTPAQNSRISIYLNYDAHLRYQSIDIAKPALGVETGPLLFRKDDTYYMVVHTLNDDGTDTIVSPGLYSWKPT